MIERLLRITEFIMTIVTNLKIRYLQIINKIRKKSQIKNESIIKKEVDNNKIDKLNDRLMR